MADNTQNLNIDTTVHSTTLFCYQDYSLKRPLVPYPSPTEKRLKIGDNLPRYAVYQQPLSPSSPYLMTQILEPVANVNTRPATTARPIAQPRKKVFYIHQTESKAIPKPSHVVSDDGKRIWEVNNSIGKGGCGEVFLGKELNYPSEYVAIKIIKDRKQFLTELNMMKLLHTHKNGRGWKG